MKAVAVPLLRCLYVALLLIGHAAAQERHLHAYTLQHALPEQIVPALSAQLSPGSSVTPYRQQLIINVTDAEYQAIQTLLEQLDTAPRSLLISVRKHGHQSDDNTRFGAQGRIGDGAVQVQTGDTWQQNTGARMTIVRNSTGSNSDGSQQVRAVEGMEAFISTGNTVAARTGYNGAREYVPIASGFYATARIVDNEVIIDIDQRDDRSQGHTIATQYLQTQVRGRIGTWIPLGSIYSSQTGDQHSITQRENSTANFRSDLAIKVDVLDR